MNTNTNLNEVKMTEIKTWQQRVGAPDNASHRNWYGVEDDMAEEITDLRAESTSLREEIARLQADLATPLAGVSRKPVPNEDDDDCDLNRLGLAEKYVAIGWNDCVDAMAQAAMADWDAKQGSSLHECVQGELPQDERYAGCLATIRDLNRISMQFAADLVGLPVVEGSRRRNVDYVTRDSVLELVTAWRGAWDKNSAQRVPIDRAAIAQRVGSGEPVAWAVFADTGEIRIWFGDYARATSWAVVHSIDPMKLVSLYTTPPNVERNHFSDNPAAVVDADKRDAEPYAYDIRDSNGDGCLRLAKDVEPNRLIAVTVTPLYTHADPVKISYIGMSQAGVGEYAKGYVRGWNGCLDAIAASAKESK